MDDSRLNDIEFEIRKASVDYDYFTKEQSIGSFVHVYKLGIIYKFPYPMNPVWDDERKSKFVESILLGAPIMPIITCLFVEEKQEEIIDGSQRIQALVDYCLGELKLCGLEILKSLNGTTISDLPTLEKDKFLARAIKSHVMKSRQSDTHVDIIQFKIEKENFN